MGIDNRQGFTRRTSVRFSGGFTRTNSRGSLGGFTILETVLVLGITGLLIMSILIGFGVTINRQRYNDSVSSFHDLIQQQYGHSANVVNGRTGAPGCVTALAPLDACRGRSVDVIAGRSITITPVGGVSTASKIVITNILASPKASPTIVNSAIDDINNYNLEESPADIETSETAWSTTIVAKGSAAAPLSAKILIVRAPTLGTTLTFVEQKTSGALSTNISTLITDANANQVTDLCVDPAGILLAGDKRAIQINIYAASASAIEIPKESDNVCA